MRLMSTSARGRGEAKLHQRDQALPARQHLGLVPVALQDLETPRRGSPERSTRTWRDTYGWRLLPETPETDRFVPRQQYSASSLQLPFVSPVTLGTCASDLWPTSSGPCGGSRTSRTAGLRPRSSSPSRMGRPLLLEGEAGVGKTEVGKTLARILDADLIRLQCYEGIDASQALYEWDYARQLLYARALQEGEVDVGERVSELYGPEFLARAALAPGDPIRGAARCCCRRARPRGRRVRGVPARGALRLHRHRAGAGDDRGPRASRGRRSPSNRTRELHDALKRRCLYHWIDFPDLEREVEIIRLRAPGVEEPLARSVAETVARLRALDLDQAARRRRGDRLGTGPRRSSAPIGRQRRRRARDARRAVKNRDDQAAGRGGLARPRRWLSAVETLVRFGRALRDAGLPVGPDRVASFCRAAALLPPGELYWAGRGDAGLPAGADRRLRRASSGLFFGGRPTPLEQGPADPDPGREAEAEADAELASRSSS